MAVNNNTIIGDFLLANTNDAQQLGLSSTMGNLSSGIQRIFDPTNGDIYNHFLDWLVKVPAFQYTRTTSFENGLKAFIKKVNYGGTVIENQVGWVAEHNYDIVDSKLLKQYFPEGLQAYHTQNRQGMFPITISRDDLRTAFTDEFGLNSLAAQIMQAPINSDELQTYQYMKELLAVYDDDTPIFTIHHDSEPTTVDDARLLLSEMVAWAQKIKYPSARFNATAKAGKSIATFENPENMVLMLTPELYGLYKVLGFGMLFNRDEAETPFRVVVMDEFPMPNVFAVLCSEDWYQVYDTEYGNYSFFDPATLSTHYFLHHWQVLSTSPFAPIVCWGTRENTAGTIVTQTVTDVNITAATENVSAGGTAQLSVELVGTINPETEGVAVKPNSVVWDIAGADASGNALQLKKTTRIDDNYVLHVQRTDIKATDTISVTGTTAYVNPSGETTKFSKTVKFTVV